MANMRYPVKSRFFRGFRELQIALLVLKVNLRTGVSELEFFRAEPIDLPPIADL
jgi:hypothetical protein